MIGFLNSTRRFFRQVILLPVLSLLFLPVLAQNNTIKFTLVDGVGEISLGKITGITQDANGYMWFSDQDKSSLTRFDGYSMHSYRYDPANPAGIGGSYPEAVYADARGFIWIGFYGMGLDRFDPRTEQFIHYRYPVLSSDTVSVVTMDRYGKLWIGTNRGIDVLDPETNSFRHFRHDPAAGNSLDYDIVRSICIDREGTVWVGTGIGWDENSPGGLNRFDPVTKTFSHYLKNHRVRAIFEDRKGRLWVGTSGNKLYAIDKASGKTTLHPISAAAESTSDHITFIREDGSGFLWIGTFESGIERYNPETGAVTHYGDGKGLLDNSGWQAFTSREGVLWFSTQSSNLYRVDLAKKPYQFYPAKAGVTAFAETSKDHIMLSTGHGIISQQPWTKPSYVGIPGELAKNDEITGQSQFLPDEDNHQWLLQNGILYKLIDEKHALQPAMGEGDFIRHAVASDKTHFLIATVSGLYKLELNTLQKTKVPGAANDISALYIDGAHALWMGHLNNNGLTRTDPSGETSYFLKGQSVNCLFEDNRGNFWAGTPKGAWVKHAGQEIFTPLWLKGSPIVSAAIIGFAADDSGYVWISSRSGVFRLNPQTNQARAYGISHGVNSSVLTGAIFRKQSGEILVGSKAGFYSFDPRDHFVPSAPPQIVLRELKVAGQLLPVPIDSTPQITLRHNQDVFSIGFAGIHFSNPGENIHLYKLEGYDADWRKAGAERTAYYFNVPPAKYIFRVRVGNNEDVWAEKSLPIEIIPAWYSNIYFRSAALLLLIGLVYAAVRRRFRLQLRRQMEKSTYDRQLAELQRRSSELEMQALRSQMNPHFIFNALNAINRFILQNNTSQASGYLTKFSRLIRFILQNSEQSLVTLERELNTLDLYLELEALRFDYHFSYSVQVDDSVDTQYILVPPLIIQPYAENAIWHGLMHKEAHGHLEIKLHCDRKWLYCIIRDDGIGRQRAGELKSKSAHQHKPMGMKITAGRMELLKKESRYASAITINDPIKKDGSPAGTEVILKIPLKYD